MTLRFRNIFQPLLILFSLAALAVALALPVQCQAQDMLPKNYFALRGGAMWPMNIDLTAGSNPGSEVSYNIGYNVSLAYGRRVLPWLRGEIEGGWMAANTDKLKLSNRGTEINDNGKEEHLYGMVGLMADWLNSSQFTPFIGGGIGVSRVKLDNEFNLPSNGNPVTRGSTDTVFAYQAVLGVAWAPRPDWQIELRGRYFGTTDRSHDNHSTASVATLDAKGAQVFTIDLGVRFNF